MPSPAADTELDILTIIEEEYAPPCEAVTKPCDRVGAYYLQHGCCGFLYPMCVEHAEEARRYFELGQKMGWEATCDICHNVLPSLKLIPITRKPKG